MKQTNFTKGLQLAERHTQNNGYLSAFLYLEDVLREDIAWELQEGYAAYLTYYKERLEPILKGEKVFYDLTKE